jgi:hypothetical protein
LLLDVAVPHLLRLVTEKRENDFLDFREDEIGLAVESLGVIGNVEATPILCSLLKEAIASQNDSLASTRRIRELSRALGKIGNVEATYPLFCALQHYCEKMAESKNAKTFDDKQAENCGCFDPDSWEKIHLQQEYDYTTESINTSLSLLDPSSVEKLVDLLCISIPEDPQFVGDRWESPRDISSSSMMAAHYERTTCTSLLYKEIKRSCYKRRNKSEVIAYVLKMLDNRQDTIRKAGIEILSKFLDDERVNSSLNHLMLYDTDAAARAMCIKILGERDPKKTLEILIEHVETQSYHFDALEIWALEIILHHCQREISDEVSSADSATNVQGLKGLIAMIDSIAVPGPYTDAEPWTSRIRHRGMMGMSEKVR